MKDIVKKKEKSDKPCFTYSIISNDQHFVELHLLLFVFSCHLISQKNTQHRMTNAQKCTCCLPKRLLIVPHHNPNKSFLWGLILQKKKLAFFSRV